MKKIVLLVKRKAGLTPEQFREDYERCHVPLALKLLPGIKDYRRNYVRHDLRYRPPNFEGAPVEPNFDVITEMTFDSDLDYQKMVRSLADPTVQAQIAEDGKRFMDRMSMQMVFVDEEVSAPGEPPS